MREIVEKLAQAEKEMAAERGAFLLFGIFLREDAPDVWDLVAASSWIDSDRAGSLRYISDKVSSVLEPKELVKLSRIVLIEPGNPALATFQRAIHVEHGTIEIKDIDFLGLPIKRAYLITSAQDTELRSSSRASQAT